MNILSIQSWVSFGHVGNAAAIFPLQRLGAEVWAIHTVQFSNHPGYGGFAGQAFPPGHIRAVVDGIAGHGALAQCDAVLSGYVGDPGVGDAILHAVRRTREANPRALYACDPVIGDVGRGEYVRPGIAAFFRDQAVVQADLLVPNQFELESLTGSPCRTLDQVKAAARSLRARMAPAGPALVFVTSLDLEETPADRLDMLIAGDTPHLLRVPRIEAHFSGAGDAIAALFLLHFLRTKDPVAAAQTAAGSLHGILRHTHEAGSPELCLIAAQAELERPSLAPCAVAC